MKDDWDELHDVKGLAEALKKSAGYIYDMKSVGFLMPGGRASKRMAMTWLADHPDFTRGKAVFVRRSNARQPVREEMGRNGKSANVEA